MYGVGDKLIWALFFPLYAFLHCCYLIHPDLGLHNGSPPPLWSEWDIGSQAEQCNHERQGKPNGSRSREGNTALTNAFALEAIFFFPPKGNGVNISSSVGNSHSTGNLDTAQPYLLASLPFLDFQIPDEKLLQTPPINLPALYCPSKKWTGGNPNNEIAVTLSKHSLTQKQQRVHWTILLFAQCWAFFCKGCCRFSITEKAFFSSLCAT